MVTVLEMTSLITFSFFRSQKTLAYHQAILLTLISQAVRRGRKAHTFARWLWWYRKGVLNAALNDF